MKPQSYLGLTLQHFHYFLKIAELGTMVKAAREMNVSQPLLSQKVAQMEAELGVKLFRRYKNTLVLTEAGERFRRELTEIMADVDQLFQAIRTEYSGESECCKVLRIGCSNGEEVSRLNLLDTQMQQAFPSTAIDFVFDNRPSLQNKLLSGDLDVLYMTDTENFVKHKSVNYRKIYQASLYCVVDAASPIGQLETLTWQDLDGLVCFWPMSLKDTQITRDIHKFLKENEIDMQLDFRDIDYYTIRKYLKIYNGVTLSLNNTLDDKSFRLHHLGGLSYPCIAAWKKSDGKRLERYVEKLVAIAKAMNEKT